MNPDAIGLLRWMLLAAGLALTAAAVETLQLEREMDAARDNLDVCVGTLDGSEATAREAIDLATECETLMQAQPGVCWVPPREHIHVWDNGVERGGP